MEVIEPKNGAVYKKVLPSWRVSTADSFPEGERDQFYLGYYVENVGNPSPFLAEYIKHVPTYDQWYSLMKQSSSIKTGDAIVTGEFFKDGKVAYMNTGGRHQDIVEGEGKDKEDVLAHFKITKISEDSMVEIVIWTLDVDSVRALGDFFIAAELEPSSEFSIQKTSDLFNPYEGARTHYLGTLGDYRQSVEEL